MYFIPRSQLSILQSNRLAANWLLAPVVDLFTNDRRVDGLWVPYALVAMACGMSTKRVEEALVLFGPFVWSMVFESAHCPGAPWNFIQRSFLSDNVSYPSTEHYYQSRRIKDKRRTMQRLQELCAIPSSELYKWCLSGGGLSRSEFVGTAAWDEQRDSVMAEAVALRYSRRCLARKLLDLVGTLKLISVEDGDWGWDGGNRMADILQKYRVSDSVRQ